MQVLLGEPDVVGYTMSLDPTVYNLCRGLKAFFRDNRAGILLTRYVLNGGCLILSLIKNSKKIYFFSIEYLKLLYGKTGYVITYSIQLVEIQGPTPIFPTELLP